MKVLTIRLPDEKHDRLLSLAKSQGVSMNKLIEEISTAALAEFDAETRFRARAALGSPEKARAALGSPEKALAILDAKRGRAAATSS